jgi:hypothetical protein
VRKRYVRAGILLLGRLPGGDDHLRCPDQRSDLIHYFDISGREPADPSMALPRSSDELAYIMVVELLAFPSVGQSPPLLR